MLGHGRLRLCCRRLRPPVGPTPQQRPHPIKDGAAASWSLSLPFTSPQVSTCISSPAVLRSVHSPIDNCCCPPSSVCRSKAPRQRDPISVQGPRVPTFHFLHHHITTMKRSYSQMDDVSAVGGERPNPAAPHAFHSATPSASASNGDYTPKISRKIRACKLLLSYVLASASAMYPPAVDPVQSLRPLTRPLGKECQSRKVKCDLAEGNNTCARCRRLGLKCVINKSLQTLLDDENE